MRAKQNPITVNVGVKVDRSTLERFNQAAKAQGLRASTLGRQLIQEFLDRELAA